MTRRRTAVALAALVASTGAVTITSAREDGHMSDHKPETWTDRTGAVRTTCTECEQDWPCNTANVVASIALDLFYEDGSNTRDAWEWADFRARALVDHFPTTCKERMKRIAALTILAGALLAPIALPVPAAHASPPDCTDADRSQGSGLAVADGRATYSFTLERDCGIGLTSYEVRGGEQVKYDTQSANTAGPHTLSVRVPPCYQVDAHNGEVHNRGEGKAIRYEKNEGQCETTSSTTSTSSTTTPSSSTTTTTTSPPDTPTTTPASCVPDCENPDAPEHPQLAYGGAPDGAVPMALFGLAAILLGGAPLVWEGKR